MVYKKIELDLLSIPRRSWILLPFFLILYVWSSFFVPLPFSSTSYVLSFRVVFFCHGLDFLHQLRLCEKSINQSIIITYTVARNMDQPCKAVPILLVAERGKMDISLSVPVRAWEFGLARRRAY